MFYTPAYCASKYGVVGFSRSIGINSIKDSVQVKCICPGSTDTPLFRKGLEKLDEDIKARKYANAEFLE